MILFPFLFFRGFGGRSQPTSLFCRQTKSSLALIHKDYCTIKIIRQGKGRGRALSKPLTRFACYPRTFFPTVRLSRVGLSIYALPLVGLHKDIDQGRVSSKGSPLKGNIFFSISCHLLRVDLLLIEHHRVMVGMVEFWAGVGVNRPLQFGYTRISV
jgi:hypothetical protein